jgi:hypothetical protein
MKEAANRCGLAFNRIKLGVDDAARSQKLLKGIVGKRLTYRRPDKTANS